MKISHVFVLCLAVLLSGCCCGTNPGPAATGDENKDRAVSPAPAPAPANRAEDSPWGTIKGQVVFNGPVPERSKIDVSKNPDANFCTKDGTVPVLSDELVVDPKTKGVRWVLVWLIDEKGGNKVPIHPKLAKPTGKVVLDQPCCAYEPHVLGIREGQVLEAKNSASKTHNVFILGGDENPNKNVSIPPGKSLDVEDWKAVSRPVPVQCTIHTWMKAHIGVFAHPYFAVTNEKGEFEIKDAPAGKFRLMIWQETVGWGEAGKKGIPIEIKGGAVTEVPTIKITPEK
jgi:hypothetical protein